MPDPTETVHCPDAGLCGGECALHEPDDVAVERERARVRAAIADLKAEYAALRADEAAEAAPMEDHEANVAAEAAIHREKVLAENAAALAALDDAERADAFTRAVTIDAWIERVALAAHRLTETGGDRLIAQSRPPVLAVHPDDEAAMRRAHSATPTDGPLKLWGIAVVADDHVTARTARLRYDVEVPL